ncbi:hypothetical protein SAMN05444377_1237 [Flavobacterium fontis]|uniref:HEAT repeat-containing protein n=1 Tax=Flavobacterium fontis TaxID=1124188 RepID=A0A1M5EXB4_9FLAO|nr:hypothetical protein [Flavobacterium fontis]SHF83632.1 hypothetical protein SAMN05444377_1237 [Flavobacterium fontis]
MKILLLSLFSFLTTICFSQTKQNLIRTIEKANIVESDCVGTTCEEGKQYLNFQKLKKLISEKELLDLTNSQKPVLRSYAYREVIQPNNENVVDFLISELKKNQQVRTYEGCIEDLELISSFVYHEYWNKIRIDAAKNITGDNEKEQVKAMQMRLENDLVMRKLDSVIINSDKKIYWLLYLRAFENRKHNDSFVPRIEKLAFEDNNVYALLYLNKYYATQSKEKIKSYFEDKFLKVTFKEEKDSIFLPGLIEFLINSNDKRLTEIAIEKLKQDRDVWKNDSYRIMNMLEKHSLKL